MKADKCQRCGEKDEDFRTLWMSCFYAMDETGLPFKQVKNNQAETSNLPNNFFTLRVCKDCRADWMQGIVDWFQTQPYRPEIGSGIFIRERGANREISREEWDRRNPGREPVIWRKGR